MYRRKTLKRQAKACMKQSSPHFMLVALVYLLLTTGLETVASLLSELGWDLSGTLSLFLTIAVNLFSIVLGIGLANYALLLSRREEAGVGSLFTPFAYTGRSIGLEILIAIRTFLWSFLFVGAYSVLYAIVATYLGLGAVSVVLLVLLTIAMVVWLYIILLRYSLSEFALVEDPEGGAFAAVRRSVEIMRGFTGKFLVLLLSFVGWYVLIGLLGCAVVVVGVFVGDFYGTLSLLTQAATTDLTLLWEVYDNLLFWILLAEIITLIPSMWLVMYQQATIAMFYNYVGGYDYQQLLNQTQGGGENTLPQDTSPVHNQTLEPWEENSAPRRDYYHSILPREDEDRGEK